MFKKILVLLGMFFVVTAWVWPMIVRAFSNDHHQEIVDKETKPMNLLYEEDHDEVTNEKASNRSQRSNSKLVRVNEATVSELKEIHGVGDELAEKIIEELTENGPFLNMEDLLRVNGIGKKKLETIQANVKL